MKYNAAHREEQRIYSATYQVAHREEKRAYAAAYYLAHREEKRAATAAYYIAHHEERLAVQAAYNTAHRQERRDWNASTAHREKLLAWRVAHPEKFREYAHRRRARLRSQFVAPVDVQAIYLRDQGRCHICGKRVKQADTSMDHLIPLSLGGVHAPHNVALAHLKCNLKRNNRGVAQLLLALNERDGSSA